MVDRVLELAKKQRDAWRRELENLKADRKTTVEVKDDGSRGADDTADTMAEIYQLLSKYDSLIFRLEQKTHGGDKPENLAPYPR